VAILSDGICETELNLKRRKNPFCFISKKMYNRSLKLSLSKPPKEISISKDILPDLPNEFEETTVGDRRGSVRQFRADGTNVHIREYEDKFTIHIDREDPRKNPMGHLIKDSPETIAAFATSLYFQRKNLETSKRTERGRSSSPISLFGLANPFSFLVSFLILNAAFRRIKELLLG
jgi:hypothetical protein